MKPREQQRQQAQQPAKEMAIEKSKSDLVVPEHKPEIENAMAIINREKPPAFCFDWDTPVILDNIRGYTEIGEIEKGYPVLSRCETTGEIAYKEVLTYFETEGHFELWGVKYQRANEGWRQHGFVRATPEHPFWVDGHGWKAVKDLQVGDLLLTHDGKRLPVTDVAFSGYTSDVYNLEVEGFNTYFVGHEGIWVHNCDPAKSEV